MTALEVAAWIAGFACFATYVLLSWTKGRRIVPYHVANVLGGIVLVAFNAKQHAYPNLVLEIPYTIVAFVSLVSMWRKRKL